jgi:hypothetical protein
MMESRGLDIVRVPSRALSVEFAVRLEGELRYQCRLSLNRRRQLLWGSRRLFTDVWGGGGGGCFDGTQGGCIVQPTPANLRKLVPHEFR